MASKWRIALLLGSNVPVVPLPVVRYISDGLIFEHYGGGQPLRQFVIHWERLRPTIPVREENT
jgi:hypothetical protein